MSTLQQLKRAGDIALWHDYRKGHAFDFSGNANNGTLVNDPVFTRNGVLIPYFGLQAIQVPHSPSIDLSVLTVIALVQTSRVERDGNAARLFDKEDAVNGRSYSARFNIPVTRINAEGAVNGWWIVASRNFDGVKCFGLTLVSDSVNAPLYLDGIQIKSTMDSSDIYPSTVSDLYVGNVNTLNRGFGGTISAFLIFNRVLTETEHAQIFGELMRGRQ